MIDVDNARVNDKCYDMFNTWLKRTCDPCWCKVANAFKMVNLHEAAKEIEAKFGRYYTYHMPFWVYIFQGLDTFKVLAKRMKERFKH